jgi:hypothetical protein
MRLNPFFQEMVRPSGSSPSDRLSVQHEPIDVTAATANMIIQAGLAARGLPNTLEQASELVRRARGQQ